MYSPVISQRYTEYLHTRVHRNNSWLYQVDHKIKQKDMNMKKQPAGISELNRVMREIRWVVGKQ